MNIRIRAFFIIIVMQLTACVGCCPDNECAYIELEGIEFVALDNSGQEPVAIIDDTLSSRALVLRLSYLGTKSECPESLAVLKNPFCNAAYAFSCPEDQFFSPDTIVSLVIKSTAAINSDFPAGTELNSLFEKRGNTSYSQVGWSPGQKDFLLFANLEQEGVHQFYVELTMANGTIIRDSTESIFLTP